MKDIAPHQYATVKVRFLPTRCHHTFWTNCRSIISWCRQPTVCLHLAYTWPTPYCQRSVSNLSLAFGGPRRSGDRLVTAPCRQATGCLHGISFGSQRSQKAWWQGVGNSRKLSYSTLYHRLPKAADAYCIVRRAPLPPTFVDRTFILRRRKNFAQKQLKGEMLCPVGISC